jgi:acyl-[acyl-carrier-protein]-phospholipid O-acyltransferase/long-chain-fatty-acid--[acyl-carrier-protein] ligase
LSTRGLPNLFIPRRDQFIKVDAIPILGSGKLDLRAVRQMAEAAVRGGEPVEAEAAESCETAAP